MSELSQFLNQGGYAFYVWSSYGAGALLIAVEIVVLRRQRMIALQRLERMSRLKAAEQQV